VDNSPAAKRAAFRGKRGAFPIAPPFTHSLHRQLFVYIYKTKKEHTRGQDKHKTLNQVHVGIAPRNPTIMNKRREYAERYN
jgi:hypothetical protein